MKPIKFDGWVNVSTSGKLILLLIAWHMAVANDEWGVTVETLSAEVHFTEDQVEGLLHQLINQGFVEEMNAPRIVGDKAGPRTFRLFGPARALELEVKVEYKVRIRAIG